MRNRDIRVVRSITVVALWLTVRAAAVFAEPWNPGEALDVCLEAALKQRPGIVTAWRQAGGGDKPPYAVSVLNADGRIAEATCDPTNPASLQFKDKGGLYRYEMYRRATFPEAKARSAAPEIFVGPVRIIAMDLRVSFTGKPHFVYQMFLPSGHKAVVSVEATVGRLTKAEVE